MVRIVRGTALIGVLTLAGHSVAEERANSKNDLPKHAAQKPTSDANSRLLAALDTDSDGVVSHAELMRGAAQHVQKRCQVRFAQLDKNADGWVTYNEVVGMDRQRFARFDLNGDGAFTAVELRTVMQLQLARRVRQLFASMDLDRDGACDRAELERHRVAVAARAAKRQGEQVASSNTTRSGRF